MNRGSHNKASLKQDIILKGTSIEIVGIVETIYAVAVPSVDINLGDAHLVAVPNSWFTIEE